MKICKIFIIYVIFYKNVNQSFFLIQRKVENKELQNKYNLTGWILVKDVLVDLPAFIAGLQVNDVILTINNDVYFKYKLIVIIMTDGSTHNSSKQILIIYNYWCLT